MVTLDESVIARLKTHGKTFEVFVDPEGALALKRGGEVKLENILAVEDVFSDAKAGDRPAEQDVLNALELRKFLKLRRKSSAKASFILLRSRGKRYLRRKRREW